MNYRWLTCVIAEKGVPYTVNSRALTGKKWCINKGFLVLLMHRKLTFNMIAPGPQKLFRHTLFNCHNIIHWWCNRPIKNGPIKKKMLWPGFEPCFSGWASATLLIMWESRLYCKAVRLHLIPITTKLLSINYVVTPLYIRHCVGNRIENNAVFIFLRCQTENKQLWKKTYCKISASKNCRMAQEWMRLVHHGNNCL